MAIIYGIADSEKNLLKKLPGEVRNFDDMDRVKRDFEKESYTMLIHSLVVSNFIVFSFSLIILIPLSPRKFSIVPFHFLMLSNCGL